MKALHNSPANTLPTNAKYYNLSLILCSIKGEEQQADQDNWLGLGDPQASHADKNVSKSSEPISSRTESEDKKVVGSRAGQVSQDDWLGLSDENIHKTLQSEAQWSNEQMSNQIKGWESQCSPAL